MRAQCIYCVYAGDADRGHAEEAPAEDEDEVHAQGEEEEEKEEGRSDVGV